MAVKLLGTARPDSKMSIFCADFAYFFSAGFMVYVMLCDGNEKNRVDKLGALFF